MRAAVVDRFGPPDVIAVRDVPAPVPGPDEVPLDVVATHVLWVETAVRARGGGEAFDVTPPYVPGNGVLGREADGRLVLAHVGDGGSADQVAASRERLVPVPDGLDPRAAAALVHDGATAVALAEGTGVEAGTTVLVVGASGGLGIVSAQLARSRGARVVALARDASKIARLRALGVADEVVDTEDAAWVDLARRAVGPRGADVVLDNVGGAIGRTTFGLVADGGAFSAHGTPSGSFATPDEREASRRGLRVLGIADVQLAPDVLRAHLATALGLARDGAIAPVVGRTFALGDVAAAHAAVESRRVFGTTLLLGREWLRDAVGWPQT